MTGQIKQDSEMTRQLNLGKRRQQKVKDLHGLARRSLWELLLFMLISIGALTLQDFNLQGSVSEPVRQLLGYPPPAYLVSSALAAYCFAALINLLTQLANDTEPQLKWSQLGYRTVFYLFYLFSGSLASHFMAVFFIGLILYGAEQVHVWVYSSRVAHQNKELLGEQ